MIPSVDSAEGGQEDEIPGPAEGGTPNEAGGGGGGGGVGDMG